MTIAANDKALRAPFPWFGGKFNAAPIVWPRFGDTVNYIEPFAGKLNVMLQRPFKVRTETVNDLDCYLSNFWRALSFGAADEVAKYADYPVNEVDLHARHQWLVNQHEFRERMMSDPHYYDPKIAGWWVWGICAWIGNGWCDVSGANISTKLPHLGDKGRGIRRKRPHLAQQGDGGGRGVHRAQLAVNGRSRPNLRPAQGINRQLPMLRGSRGATGQGINAAYARADLYAYMNALAKRTRRTRVCCGDWTRVLGKSVTYKIGTTAVFLDPPYNKDAKRADVYAVEDTEVSTAVREWALENGDNPKLRIALCGYEREHGRFMPDNWECVTWKAPKGYAGQRKNGENNNRDQERIWFSPHCLNVTIASGMTDHRDYSDLFSKQKQPQ